MIARSHSDTAYPPDGGSTDPFDVLAAFSHDLGVSGNLEGAVSTLLEGVVGAIDAMAGGLFLTTADGKPPTCRTAVGAIGPADLESAMDYGLLSRCLERNTAESACRDGLRGGDAAVRSLLCVPLLLDEQRLGVVAVVNKRQGLFQGGDVRLLEAVAGLLALTVANSRMARVLKRQEGVSRELELAAEIQRNLLPRSDLEESPVIGLNLPIREVSGDFFDFLPLGQGRISFALGDVSGKGINAALLMAKAAGLFRCLAKGGGSPADLLMAINREICETASRGMFVTMVAGIYNSATGSVRFANAGHEPPLLRAPDRSYRSFPAAQPPLGILPELSIQNHEIELGGGEFYIFSDGLTEYRYGAQEALGVEGVIQLVESLADLPLDRRLRALLSELDHEGWQAEDDLTVLAIDDAWVGRHD
jgi:sigma-B regulation protein RsbU (phosphoserine phosphatase)